MDFIVKIELLTNYSRNNHSFSFLSKSFFLQTQNAYEREISGQGYDVEELKDSDEATEEEEKAMEEAEEEDDDDD
jgi:hypothetical protein